MPSNKPKADNRNKPPLGDKPGAFIPAEIEEPPQPVITNARIIDRFDGEVKNGVYDGGSKWLIEVISAGREWSTIRKGQYDASGNFTWSPNHKIFNANLIKILEAAAKAAPPEGSIKQEEQ